jgi:ferredoxin
MEEIKKLAKELLAENKVQLVLAFENGTGNRVRPAFFTTPEAVDKLVYNEFCIQNIALYLKKDVCQHTASLAIIANPNVVRSILQLAAENQIKEEKIKIIGISHEGKCVGLLDFKAAEEFSKTQPKGLKEEDRALIEKLQAMSLEEKFDYWVQAFSPCIKCYACRASCPMCYCGKCNVESNNPQWIPVAPHKYGNMEWHIMRAMHLAGRCINCGECNRSCPVDIPLNILSYMLSDFVLEEFESEAGMSAVFTPALSSFTMVDKENFIK